MTGRLAPALMLAVATAAATGVHVPVSTTSASAQAAFDRGLFAYYAYDREASARAFAAAASADPTLAMAAWGEALADGPDLNTPETPARFDAGKQAIAQAQSLLTAHPAGASERALIAAMALRFEGSYEDWPRDDAAYRAAMVRLAAASADPTARSLAAEALLEHQQTDAGARDLIAQALALDPADPMANHLCIHLVDESADRTFARLCAQRLDAATFPPLAEHLAHMPAHYWIETGDYAKALASSGRAVELLQQLQASGEDAAHVERYAKHDVGVGYSAAMMLGNYAAAQRWSARMRDAFEIGFDGLTALRFARYERAYAASPDEMAGTVVRGYAALLLGKTGEARAIGDAIRKQLGPSGGDGYLPQLFLARVAEAAGRDDEAVQWYRRARINELGAFGAELIPLFPADEALGGFYYRRGRYADAAAAFERDLSAYPSDPRALFGLSLAQRALGRTADAAQTAVRFEAAWAGADTTLTPNDL